MHGNFLFYCLLGISTIFLPSTVAREAIVGGHIVLTSTVFPFQATIMFAEYQAKCGGGIIDKYLILTAAHCVIAENGGLIGKPISAFVGTHNLETEAGVIHEVEKIYVPTDYNRRDHSPRGDIAVLKLKKVLEMKDLNLKQLRLGRMSSYNITLAKIAGFGWDWASEEFGYNTDYRLRFLDVNLISEEQCKHDHPHLNEIKKYICARAKSYSSLSHRGACIGDSGGPLVHTGNIVIGVLSEPTFGCDEKKTSAIYTSVAEYRDFINYAKKNLVHRSARLISV